MCFVDVNLVGNWPEQPQYTHCSVCCCLCEAVLVCVVAAVKLVMPFSLVSTHTSDPALSGWRVVLQ